MARKARTQLRFWQEESVASSAANEEADNMTQMVDYHSLVGSTGSDLLPQARPISHSHQLENKHSTTMLTEILSSAHLPKPLFHVLPTFSTRLCTLVYVEFTEYHH